MTGKRQESRKIQPATKRRAVIQPAVEIGSQFDPPEAGAAAVPQLVPRPMPRIVIEIESDVTGGYANGRFDITIRGRAMSADPIVEVMLQIGDRVSGMALFGQAERTPVATLPNGTPGRQHMFQFNIPHVADGAPERCAFRIVARAEDGFESSEDFEIQINSTAGDPVAVVAGPAGKLAGIARPNTVLYLERATIDLKGLLTVVGWAVALGQVLGVEIYANEERVAKANIGLERDDVGAVFSSYPGSRLAGFSLTVPLDGVYQEVERVSAQLICADGYGHEAMIPVERIIGRGLPAVLDVASQHSVTFTLPEPQAYSLFEQQSPYQVSAALRITDQPLSGFGLPGAPLPGVQHLAQPTWEAPSAEIRMHCDDAILQHDGTVLVNGWAVCGVGVVQVRILVDGADVGLASLGHERPDVGQAYADLPMARLSGFRYERRIRDGFEGEHEVKIIVRNMRDGEDETRIMVVAETPPVREQEPQVAAPATESSEAPPAEESAEFRFELDSPVVSDGVAAAAVTGRLTVDGWVLTRSGVASFQVFLDDQCLGDVHYGLARQDVGAAFPDWPNALRGGYAFHCPPRSLRDGDHTIELRIRSNNGEELNRSFGITVKKGEDQQDGLGIRRRVPRVEADLMAGFLSDLKYRPSFRFILRQGPTIGLDRLQLTLEALRAQPYADWTALVLADNESAAAIKSLVDDAWPELANRFSVIAPSDADRWFAPLGQTATGGQQILHILLLPGDEPSADALLELAVASGRHPGRDLLYGDEVRISPVSGEKEPFFKPDFSLDLLLSTNYFGRPWVITDALLAKTGATAASLVAHGEYDLLLRCSEHANGIHHVPKLLCQRFAVELDDAVLERPALERALQRRGIDGEVLETPIRGTWRVKRTVPSWGKVSIIIPTCAANGYIETCINSLRAETAYRDYEIVCIDNIPPSDVAWKVWLQQNADKVVDIPQAFNWSVFNNRAAAVADGEFLLFLNDDMEIIQEDWLDAMMEHARRPEVGITGAQLLYRDGKVQHAGMFLASNGIGRHAFRFAAKNDPCYFGLALTQRNVMAVTGACMLVRRETFERLGRFEEAHEIVNNDLDFCLRAHRAGLLTVFTPYASLIHYELASRANLKDVFDLTHFNAAWKTTFAAGDPYFNPRLSRHADDYRPDDEPVQWVVSGAPLFLPEDIQRILVVKLDHIGDFVTALPPIRRLKKLFPQARITVLAGPASRAFVALEPAIDEFIPFAFFHARSQLGERELTQEDYAELAARLRPYRFDLAIDLRKHLSTRDVLKHTGARFLAGFDYLGQCPYLDIALDWDGDRTLQRKRSHVVDDLIALVNAVGHASEADRVIMQPGPVPMPLGQLPDAVQALFVKPVVAIHPGAGNITKQWPQEHFSALMDLLITKNDVNVMLIGGPDEVAVAQALVQDVQNPDCVATMAGETPLADLPALLKNCVLYIGNDSGPKHIAAAVGIPTIGIHSGVVDPVEWGPIGPGAVALRRNMTCSPCYLAKAEDCARGLDCLRFLEPNVVYETADLLLKRSSPVVTATAEVPADVGRAVDKAPKAKAMSADPKPEARRRSKASRGQRATEAA